MGVAQQWIEGDEQSAAICVFTASHDDPFSHSISFSFLPSEAVAHLFFWVLFSFGCEDRLIAAATFLACNNVLLGGGKKEEKRGRTRRRNARPGYFDTLHKSHPSSRFVDRNCGIIHKEKKPSTVPPTPPSIARTFLPYPHCAQRFPAIVSLLSLLSFFLPRNGTGVIGVRALAMGEGSGN